MHILNSTSTADRSFGADLLRGALVAHGPYLSISHLLTREQAAPQESVDNCPGDVVAGRGRISTQVLASALWSVKWAEAKSGMRRVVVCGPQGFEGAVYDMLDIMVQQLQFEKTQPAAAREGRSVVQAAAGVPVPQDRLRQLQEERAATSRFNLPFHHSKSGGSDGRSSSDSNGGGGAREYGHGHAAIEDRPRPNAPLFRTAVAVETFDPEDAGDLPLRPGDVVE
ncbi:hypothetical protein HK405_009193, partial [Cladochytrium tenue]